MSYCEEIESVVDLESIGLAKHAANALSKLFTT